MPAMFQRCCFLGGLSSLLLTLPHPVWAQTDEVELPPSEGTVTDLRVEPRYTIDYNSSGGGYEGFGGFEVFLPLEQVPGKTVSFAIGRVNLSNNADVSGNLQIGTRSLGNCWLIAGECLFGGYFGIDFTNTGAALFPQLGVGVEMLGDLDLRLNGYLPIGDTSRTVSEGTFVSATGSQFQGNNLIFFDANHPGLAEVALMGLDAEVGGRLIQFGNGGDLRGYGGVYTYGGSGINQYLGGRFRLEARPTPNLILGAGVQFDDEFGTNILFRVGATLPNPAQQQRFEQAPLYARMSDPIGRLNSVVVTEQVLPPPTQIAIDPASGQPYNFVHVAPGRGNSSGTVEDPTNTVAEAVAVATPKTDIIYVQSGNAGGGFTIPDGVAVLSVAPVQWINTQVGALPLPGSGQGEAARPLITDTVTMGNDTVLSGFTIQPPNNQRGVVAENTENIRIEHNGISVANLSDNPTGLSGILVSNNSELSSGEVVISNNNVRTSGNFTNGIVSNTRDGNALLLDNVVTTDGDRSIGIIGSNYNGPIAITNNTISISGSGGNPRLGYTSGIIGVGNQSEITGNRIATIGSNAQGIVSIGLDNNNDSLVANNIIETYGTLSAGISTSFAGKVTVINNQINTRNNQSNGIIAQGAELVIANNFIMTSGERSSSIVVPNSISTMVFGNHIMTIGSNSPGINILGSHIIIDANVVSAIGNQSDSIRIIIRGFLTSITDNLIERSGQNGITLTLPDYVNTSGICAVLSGNSVLNTGSGFGYRLNNSVGGIFQIVDSSPTFADTQASNIGTFSFEPNVSSFTNVVTCSQN